MTELNEKKDNDKSRENKYKQLALFSVIVAEVVVTPSALGGVTYWLLSEKPFQLVATAIAAFVGLGAAFYRIYRVYQNQKGNDE